MPGPTLTSPLESKPSSWFSSSSMVRWISLSPPEWLSYLGIKEHSKEGKACVNLTKTAIYTSEQAAGGAIYLMQLPCKNCNMHVNKCNKIYINHYHTKCWVTCHSNTPVLIRAHYGYWILHSPKDLRNVDMGRLLSTGLKKLYSCTQIWLENHVKDVNLPITQRKLQDGL